jgi:hypothetical protein
VSRTAKDVFDDFSQRLGWDVEMQADVLANWCLEGMIEPLLRYIQEAGQTDDFDDWLILNFGEGPKPEAVEKTGWQTAGF